MARRRVGLLWLCITPLLSSCLAYPKIHSVTKKGTAVLDDGRPVIIKASLIKTCETLKGESEKIIRFRETSTDDKGRYRLAIRGVAWNFKNFLTGSGCASRVQLFVCRESCKPVDDIDIEILGK